MVPDLNLQLHVVIKALRDVVAPAVDSANRSAIEQLHLSIMTLELVETRLPLVRKRVRRELANAIALAETVVTASVTTALGTPLAAARASLGDADVDTVELDTHRVRLLALISDVANRSPDAASDRAIGRAVIAASKPQLDLARAWCLPAGFEPDPHEVPTLADLLARKGGIDGKQQS